MPHNTWAFIHWPADQAFLLAEVPLLGLLGSRTTDHKRKSWGLYHAPQNRTAWYHENPMVQLAYQTGSSPLPSPRVRAFHHAYGP